MKTLYWDVETTDLELSVRTYQLKNYTKYHNWKDIKRDWTMLGAAWQFDHENTPSVISVTPSAPLDDRQIIKFMHGILEEADVIIGHNSDNFDIKKFNTRAAFYGLPPLSPKIQIDTLKIARKYFKFTSNTLGYICSYLGLIEKEESPDWKKCIEGCPDELRKMRSYNKMDITTLIALHKYLAPYHNTHPKIKEEIKDVAGNVLDCCNKCGSANIIKKGYKYLKNGRKRQKHKCLDCGGWQSGKLM